MSSQTASIAPLSLRARRDVFAGKRWERWERQGAVTIGTRTVRVDMLHRKARLAVEFDGARFHGDDSQRRRDLERDALLAGAGFTTMRFTWEDIAQRPQWCVTRVLEALRARGVTP
ncbi:endonuclease domain-containing protein [Demequina litorisediminis]|uniref:endonuclease domain-containing protein n=1 Tax=Demequina litorisediminis TaxID=1849022 RepID=UPI0024E0BBD8|nr:DUF559 domain-containing protein [Demequina litorisediminis]